MELITPKTNWKISDHLTYTDWNRIVNNLHYLKEYGSSIEIYSALADVELTSEYQNNRELGWLFAEDINAVENDLENINRASAVMDIGTKQTFEAYGRAITYTELNRIESMTLALFIDYTQKDPTLRVGTEWIAVPSADDIPLL
jgi:hypothetical protein